MIKFYPIPVGNALNPKVKNIPAGKVQAPLGKNDTFPKFIDAK